MLWKKIGASSLSSYSFHITLKSRYSNITTTHKKHHNKANPEEKKEKGIFWLCKEEDWEIANRKIRIKIEYIKRLSRCQKCFKNIIKKHKNIYLNGFVCLFLCWNFKRSIKDIFQFLPSCLLTLSNKTSKSNSKIISSRRMKERKKHTCEHLQ